MAIDETDQSDAGGFSDGEASAPASEADRSAEVESGPDVRVGEYTWAEFMEEHGYGDEVSTLYPDDPEPEDQLGLDTDEPVEPSVPSGDDWDRVEFDPEPYLGYHPDDLEDLITDVAAPNANALEDAFLEFVDPETTYSRSSSCRRRAELRIEPFRISSSKRRRMHSSSRPRTATSRRQSGTGTRKPRETRTLPSTMPINLVRTAK